MTERAFLPDPDNANEAKLAVRKAGRDANEHAEAWPTAWRRSICISARPATCSSAPGMLERRRGRT